MDIRIGEAEDMPGYLARPTGEGPWPGVVVVFDVVGMSHDVRNQSDWLASRGYLALAPDLFFRGRMRCVTAMVRDFARNEGPTFETLEAVRSWLVARPDCTGKVGILGFCLGGGFALAFAPGRGFSAASANYGHLPRHPESFFEGSCPVVASYGAKDPTLRGAARKLEAALTRNGVPHDVKEYPEASHSFLNDHDSSDLTPFARFAMRAAGSRYHQASALDARERIGAFFDAHLVG